MDDAFGTTINKNARGYATANVEGVHWSQTSYEEDVTQLGSGRAPDSGDSQLTSVRRRLADVSDELDELQRQFHVPGFAPPHLAYGTAARAGDSSEARSLELQLRHVEVDRDEAIARASRLAAENKQLLQMQEQLRAELRIAHQTLGVLKRQLGDHADVEHSAQQSLLSETTQQPPLDFDFTISDARSPGAPSSAAAPEAPITSSDKRRMRKDRERAESLGALVEKQRGEIFLLRRRGDIFEAYAKECEQRLQRPPAGGLQGHRGCKAIGLSHPSLATRGPNFRKSAGAHSAGFQHSEQMPRQLSAPGRLLPSMTAA